MHKDWKLEDSTLRKTFLCTRSTYRIYNITWYTFWDARPMFYEILSNLLKCHFIYIIRIFNDYLYPPNWYYRTIQHDPVATKI